MSDTLDPNTTDLDKVKVETTVSADKVEKSKVEPEKPSSTKSTPPKKINKKVVVGLVSILVVLVLVLGMVFLRLGNQTVLARSLDAFGQHKLAYSADFIGGKGLTSKQVLAANLDLSNLEDCAKIWDVISNQSLKEIQNNYSSTDIFKQSSITSFLIQPVSNGYKDKFKVEGAAFTSQDIKASSGSLDANLDFTVDFDTINKIAPEPFPVDLGLSNLKTNFKAILESQTQYVSIPQLSLKTKQFDEKGDLSGWYKNTLAEQVSNEEFLNVLKRFETIYEKNSGKKLSDAISEDTGKFFLKYVCSGIKSYKVGAPITKTFGVGQLARTRDVRPITVELKPDFYSIYLRGLPDLMEKITQDSKIKPFLKANYESFKEISEISNNPSSANTQPASSSFLTQDEFNKIVDDMFKDFDKQKVTLAINMTILAIDESVKININPITTYMDMEFLHEYGGDISMVITPSSSSLSNMGNSELGNMLKDGVLFSSTVYDIKYGSRAEKLPIPSDTKNIESLAADLQNTSLVKKLMEISASLTSATTKTADVTSSPVDPTMMPTPEMGDGTGVIQNPDGTMTMPDGTVFDPKSVSPSVPSEPTEN